MSDIPRRKQYNLNTNAEIALRAAMLEIERMPADVRTTQAVLLVESARNIIADIVDENIKNNAFTE